MTFNELNNELFQNYESGKISDEQLVQIFERISHYLNLKTITNTANFRNKSYNGIKKFANHDLEIDGQKFYKNND